MIVDSGCDCPDCGGIVMAEVVAEEAHARGLAGVGSSPKAEALVRLRRVWCETCGREFA